MTRSMRPTNPTSNFEDVTVEERALSDRPLRIAVLGPSLADIRDIGARKRLQIRDALMDQGHAPFFPEDVIDSSAPDWIGQERELLLNDSVDLVIILHTKNSWGAFSEVANFASFPEIRIKTAVLFPSEHYEPMNSLPANIVQSYFVRLPYTDRHMELCQLVSECVKWADDKRNGVWPELPSQYTP